MEGYEDRIFKDYGHSIRILLTLKLLKFISMSSTTPCSILDIGCDGGVITNRINHFSLVVGIDLSKKSLLKAKKSSNIDYVLADAENLPFRKRSFDISMCLEVLEHLPNYEECLKETIRITRSYIIVSIPANPTPLGLLAYRIAYFLLNKRWPGNNFLLDQGLKSNGHLHHIDYRILLNYYLYNCFTLKECLSVAAVAAFPWGCGLGAFQWTLLTSIPHIGKLIRKVLMILDLSLDGNRLLFPFASVYIMLFKRNSDKNHELEDTSI